MIKRREEVKKGGKEERKKERQEWMNEWRKEGRNDSSNLIAKHVNHNIVTIISLPPTHQLLPSSSSSLSLLQNRNQYTYHLPQCSLFSVLQYNTVTWLHPPSSWTQSLDGIIIIITSAITCNLTAIISTALLVKCCDAIIL